MNPETYIIRAKHLTKTYALPAEVITAVDQVTMDVKKGDFISLMGPSGSGKTTLLDLLGCLDSISSGELTVLDQDVTHAKEADLVRIRRGHIGFVFQEFLLLPELTALENVAIPMTFARRPPDRDRAHFLLERVGLGDRVNHRPRELSGGERQRVAIARSLAANPSLLLADEPTGNLDTRNSREIFSLFEKLNREDKLTIIVTTHDALLGKRAGSVIQLQDGRIVSRTDNPDR